ncbi:PAS domain-containing protein, partial [Streptomyces sp. NPDC059374]|uniref:PAS domain-containing protein n=1 Tax=Streptomyces sp. NPDC059374 TaxID=3346814 RepID=UPI0036A0B2C5
MDAPRDTPDTPGAEARREPLDAAGDAAAVVSAGGQVLAWTRAAEELLGLPAADVVGTPGLALLATPGDRARAVAVAARCRSGAGGGGRVPVPHRD